jgi:TrmH family RNA methyltransferase
MNKTFSTEILRRIRVVLSHTSHPGNIGSVARAMKTMGLSQLYLVNPQRFPDPEATALASGATDLLDNACLCTTLDEALNDSAHIVGLSARRRELTVPVQSPREVAPLLLQHAAQGENITLLFGAETSGLSNEEIRRCNYIISIPANPLYSSLNLAQAVQVIAYELRSQCEVMLEHLNEIYPLASHEDITRFYGHLEQALMDIGFLKPDNPKRLMIRLQRLFNRAKLERNEIDILRGILHAAQSFDRPPKPLTPYSKK